MAKCELCGKNRGHLYIRGKMVCPLCWLCYKHFHFIPFRRALKRKELWVEFLELHPEFIHVSHVGIHKVRVLAITAYLRSLE